MAYSTARAPRKTFEQKDNSGALFKNKERRNEKDPDYRGSIVVNGREYWVASWVNKSKAGETYMSLKVTAKTDAKKGYSAPMDEPEPFHDDEIPF